EVIVQLGHRADRAARIAHGVGLVDGDGRQDALDAVDLGLVHAIQELARIRREGFDVAALALGVQRIERQGAFPGTGYAGDDGQLARGECNVEVFEIVLAGAGDADVRAHVGRRCSCGRTGAGVAPAVSRFPTAGAARRVARDMAGTIARSARPPTWTGAVQGRMAVRRITV